LLTGLPARRVMLKVLHVQKVGGMGGSEQHLLTLLPALREAGVDARMLAPGTGPWSRFTEPLRAAGVPTTVVPAGPDLNPLVVAALLREIRTFAPDLVHTHLVHADVHGQVATGLAGVGRVSSVHGTPAFYRREPYRAAARLAGRFTRVTIAISEHVREFLRDVQLTRAERIQVVPYGIDASRWSLPGADRARARSALGLEDGDIAVGIAGRLIAGKGHSFLLEAHAAAARGCPKLRLLVAGDGPLREPLEREARVRNATVRFTGYLSDMRAFMNACDVLAFPTEPALGEGFGLAALEAMASGRPVVATRVGSLPEVVRARETGLLVRPGAVDELAVALVELAEDDVLRRELGVRAEERARSVFSVDAMVERTLAVYTRALGG
jgi:glycosyltransferase involved in cell wall biosynthesis